jgi:peptide/nickel transport system substrate-binding protein
MRKLASLPVLAALVILPGLAACAPFGPAGLTPPPVSPLGRSGGQLVYGLTLAPSGIDPHVNASSELGIPLTSVYDTLIYRGPSSAAGPDQRFVPGLAESWEISPDNLTYTFHLRRQVAFHDGTPFNAEAVRLNFERVMNPATQSQKAIFLLGPLNSVEAVDEYTVALHLSAPFAPLLDGLAQVYLGIASPAALARWGADYPFHQVGTGPFQFVEYVPNDHLTLARNDGYQWAPGSYDHPGPAYLEQIDFRFFTDQAGRAVALEAGDADVMDELPPLDAARLRRNQRFQVIPVTLPGQPLGFILNTQRPPTDDVRVRQALLWGTDRAAIVQAIFGGQSPVAYGPLTAATFSYTATLETLYPYQPDRARQLLVEAGWSEINQAGVRQRNGQPLVLDGVLQTWGMVPEVAQLLQAQWAQLGISLHTQMLTYPAALEAARQGSYHLIPQSFSDSDPNLLWTYYHSGQPFNWSKLADPALDNDLERGRCTSDPAERAQWYAQAQLRIMEQAVLVPIRDPVNLNGATARVQDLRFDAHGWFPLLHDVYLK